MARSNRKLNLNLSRTFSHEELVCAAVGRFNDKSAVDSATKRRLSLAETTKILADRIIIGSGGAVNPYREGRGLAFLDTLDGSVTPENAYCNQNWLPIVSSYNRRLLARNLAIFLELSNREEACEIVTRDGEIKHIPGTYPGKRLNYRYMVLTGGPRIPLGLVKNRIIYIRQVLRKLRKSLKENYGNRVEIVFSGLEITLKRDSAGTIWTHPHLNIVYCTHEKIDWNQFLTTVSSAVEGNHWADCGVISNPNEVVKYVTKQQTNSDQLDESILAADGLLEEGDRYGSEIGLLDLTPDELWLYVQQCCGFTNLLTGEQFKPKLLTPSGAFRQFNSFINDPTNGIKIVMRQNEQGQLEYVLQAKKTASNRKQSDVLTPGASPEPENVVITETSAHPNNVTYLTTTKLLVRNYTEQPKTEQGRINLNTIRQLQAQRQNQAISNGAKLVDKAGREVEPYFYLPTPDVRFGGSNRFTISTTKVPRVQKHGFQFHHGVVLVWFNPELSEERFVSLINNLPPPRGRENLNL